MKRAKNKIITTLLAVTMAFSLTACGVSQDNLDSAVTPLSEQITQIDGYIDALESKVATLETDLSAVNTALEGLEEKSATKTALAETKVAIESEIATIKTDIQALKEKDSAFASELSALDGRLTTLETSVATLNTTITALQAQVEENTNKIEELENRINCLEGKHEAKIFSYVYTWSETAPTSTKNYTCLHCEKVIEETVSPSVWSVGDKVTYVAKDGNSYVSTVGEVTDGKAVLINETVNTVEYTYANWTDEKVLSLLDNVGARYPSESEAVATLYQAATDPYVDSNDLTSAKYRYLAVYQEDTTVMYRYSGSIWMYNERSHWGSFNNRTAMLYYCYVWDIPITTAE